MYRQAVSGKMKAKGDTHMSAKIIVKVFCTECGGEMHRMKDHMADRYECEKCGHAVAPEYVDTPASIIEAANELSHNTAAKIAEMREALEGFENDNVALLAENERLHKQISALILLDSAKF